MEPSFIRQQMEARLAEFTLFCGMYIDHCEKERKHMEDYLSNESRQTFVEVLKDLREMYEATTEFPLEIALASNRLKQVYDEYLAALKVKREEVKKRLSTSHEGITILRMPLKWSSYGHSAGFDEANSLLDIEYQGGKVYRYKNVPKELFEKIQLISSLRDLKKIIDGFEFVML